MAFHSHTQRDFISRPRSAENLSKYRDSSAQQDAAHKNIMYDRRVVRGNTHARVIRLASMAEIQRQQELKRRAIAHQQATERLRAQTPATARGRIHTEVQTELYLEGLSEIIQTSNIDCETDAFMDRPTTPLFIPAKRGLDTATQIEGGDLFDFDREVLPYLEVLIGKTLEQSLLEVMEEEEMAFLRCQQRTFHELRNAELAELMRLEEQERRRVVDKANRFAQEKEALQRDRELVEKITAQAFARQYISDFMHAVLTALWVDGYFYDPVKADIETNFCPWLMSEINNNLENRFLITDLLDLSIYDVTE